MHSKSLMLVFFGLSISLVMLATIYSQKSRDDVEDTTVPFLHTESTWVDSMMSHMTLEEKAGQLLMLVANPDSSAGQPLVTQWLNEFHVGGVLFRNYTLDQQYQRTHLYQAYARTPLLIGMQGQQHSDEFVQFPDDWSLAAINEDELVRKLGQEVARQSNELGAHLYITPYKQHRSATIEKVLRVTDEIQHKQVLACARFEDPHTLEGTAYRWQDSLWAPYQRMSHSGLSALMLDAELMVKDSAVNVEGTFSMRNYLRERTGFEGLLVSELSDTADITVYMSKLMRAGVDMVMLDRKVDEAARTLVRLVRGNYLSEAEIDEKVRKVLQAKSWAGAVSFHASVQNKRLPAPPASAPPLLNRELAEASITLIKDEPQALPFKGVANRNFYVLTIGGELPRFKQYLNYYSAIHGQAVELSKEEGLVYQNKAELALFNTLIVAFDEMDLDTVMNRRVKAELTRLAQTHDLVVVNFGSPKNLAYLADAPSLVQAYNNRPLMQEMTAQMMFGGVGAQGKLPVNIGTHFAAGTGIKTEPIRLAYSIPEVLGINSLALNRIDSIVYEGISEFAMPGCQVLVAKEGQVIYNKAFGHQTYAGRQPVRETDMYDLASITKVAATTMASMKMYETRKLALDAMLGEYFKQTTVRIDSTDALEIRYTTDTMRYDAYVELYGELDAEEGISLVETPEVPRAETNQNVKRFQDSLVVIYTPIRMSLSEESNIFRVSMRELLTHHSGLDASLPILNYMHHRRGTPFGDYYDRIPGDEYNVQVAGNFYLSNRLLDSLWKETQYLKLNESRNYKYSDANMVLVQRAIDSINGYGIHHYLDSNFYEPLGLQTMRFNPRRTVIAGRLVPTEYDKKWRKQLLRGYVHDPTAAIMGGVSGNAGLFSNANDLAILFQMLIDGGAYGGERLLQEETVKLFTDRHMGHRGLGFDKPPLRGRYTIASTASPNSFGHTGFTGTCVWADPDEDMVFVFLSNRVHPSAGNRKLIDLRIRERIHETVYQAIAASRTLELDTESMEGKITSR